VLAGKIEELKLCLSNFVNMKGQCQEGETVFEREKGSAPRTMKEGQDS
jgi:hypothetical protein